MMSALEEDRNHTVQSINLDIEKKRNEMVEAATILGFSNPQTLRLSEELDIAILSVINKSIKKEV
ncbi:aspartyl-phosphate phosphatase Spo0E family protein [Metabacillus endolithicus]|uniref:aspartyl-phosphate phosphatase Spo0E family protein n=1 Tax=Metabacillus endolithicus TaxID=1535204 RepID=UPI00366AED57